MEKRASTYERYDPLCKDVLTSALGPFGLDPETALMDEVERLDGVATHRGHKKC
jgi:hypothetical protein